jgi:hypothetical protein
MVHFIPWGFFLYGTLLCLKIYVMDISILATLPRDRHCKHGPTTMTSAPTWMS